MHKQSSDREPIPVHAQRRATRPQILASKNNTGLMICHPPAIQYDVCAPQQYSYNIESACLCDLVSPPSILSWSSRQKENERGGLVGTVSTELEPQPRRGTIAEPGL